MPAEAMMPPTGPVPAERPSFFRRIRERKSRTARVEDLMSNDLLVCQSTDSCASVANRMRQGNVGMLPVLEGTKVVGVVTDRDIALRHVGGLGVPSPHTAVEGCMTHSVVAVPPGAKVEEGIRKMRDNQVRRLLVMDGERLRGVLTLDDILIQTNHSSDLDRVVKDALKGGIAPTRV